VVKKVPSLPLSAGLICIVSILSLFINTESPQSSSHFLFCFKWYQNIWLWIIINISIVFLWRGTWGLIDIFFYPDNLQKSYAYSVALGVILSIIAYALGKTDFAL
jgi:hypothetical protein